MGDMLRSATMMASAFPALAQRVNGAPLAYLDNAATTHVPQPVLAAMRGFDERDRANIHRGVHTLSQRATDAYERARDTLARFVGANGEHLLVFTSGATDALNLVANGLSVAGHTQAVLQEGDEIIVSARASREPRAVADGRAPLRREAADPASGSAGQPACSGPRTIAGAAHARVRGHRVLERDGRSGRRTRRCSRPRARAAR